MHYTVGLQRLPYQDKTRMNWQGTGHRPLLTDIWYPAEATAHETDIFLGPPDTPLFKVGRAARDAPLLPGQYPLVLLSHGTGGATLQLGWLASYLASYGYIVAGVNHHGNNGLEPYTAEGFVLWWERAKDVTAILDHLFEDRSFGNHIDRKRVGAAGFSLGGFTVIALAGGILDLQAFRAVYQNPERDLLRDVPPEFSDPQGLVTLIHHLFEHDTEHKLSYRDPRIQCVFAIAPVLGEAFTPGGLAGIEIPISIVVGEADLQAPPATNATRFVNLIQNTQLTILDKAAHYTFLGESTELGKQVIPELCVDPPGVDRPITHQQVSQMAKEFFDQYLQK